MLLTFCFIIFLGLILYVLQIPPFNQLKEFTPEAPKVENQIPEKPNTTEVKPAANPKNPSQKETTITNSTVEPTPTTSGVKVSRVKNEEEYFTRAKNLVEKNFINLAIAEYQSALKVNDTNPKTYIELGRLYNIQKDYLNAKVNFDQALSLDPNNLEAKIGLIKTSIGTRKPKEAYDLAKSITTHNQTSKYYEGILDAFYGKYEDSKRELNEAVNSWANTENYSETIVNNAKNYLSAFDEYSFNQGGEIIHLKTLLARSYAQTGEFDLAVPLVYEVFDIKLDYRDAWIILGYSYLNLEKYSEAIETLEKARKIDPDSATAYFYLGLSYQGANNLTKASQALEKAKELNFKPTILIDQKLADIYLQLKDYQKSAASFETLLAANDNNLDYFIRPVWMYIEKLNQPDKAVQLAQKALLRHPEAAMSYNLMGWATLASNNTTEAEKYLKEAQKRDPNLDAVYLNLGMLYEQKGDKNLAASEYKKAIKISGPNSSVGIMAQEKFNVLIGNTNSFDATNIRADLLTAPVN